MQVTPPLLASEVKRVAALILLCAAAPCADLLISVRCAALAATSFSLHAPSNLH